MRYFRGLSSAIFRQRMIRVATPSRPAMRPHASSGAAPRACAKIASRSSCGSLSESATAMADSRLAPARHGGDDHDLAAVGHRRVHPAALARVLVADVDVYVPAQPPAFIEHTVAEAGVA